MPRRLVRFGPAYRTVGKTRRKSSQGTVELLETVYVDVSIWKEHGRAQRWASMKVYAGVGVGDESFEVFVPLEAMSGEEPQALVDDGATAIVD